MIARHHHNRIVQIMLGAKRIEQTMDHAVGLKDFVVVPIRLVQLLENLVRLETGTDAVIRAREDMRLLELHAEVVRGHQVHVEKGRTIS